MSKRVKKWLLGILGLVLGLLWLFPFYLILTNSMKTPKGIFSSVIGLPVNGTFSNYTQAWAALDFIRSLFNSLTITIVSVVLICLASSMAAYAIQRNHSKVSNVILMLFVAAMLIPFQSVMIPLTTIFGKAQMLNIPSLIFMYLGFGASLSIFLYQGAIAGIPEALDEAATLEGAGHGRIFFTIILPMLNPMTVTVAILNIVWIWNDYLLPSLVLPQSGYTIPLQTFFFFGQFTKQWNLALAGLMLGILPVIIFYFFAQRWIIKGVTDGSVK
ncbi:carbohydrate ABC transporter permease [Schleiferilactobacillus harbinensis]|uniref:carbohydrate ABC transporter permease n=1 Tax=Schleiferilactobacillus harbinensis TaxID=304207 RepID=UPI0039EA741F